MATPDRNQRDADESIVSVLERVRPRVGAVLARYRIPLQDAEDLVQEAALSLVTSWTKIDDPEAWILGVLKYRCAQYWRARQRRLWEAIDDALLEALAEPQQPASQDVDLVEDLGRAVAKLPSRCQSLFQLRYRLGFTPRETAQRMGYSETSIGTIVNRCLSALGRCLMASGFFVERRGA